MVQSSPGLVRFVEASGFLRGQVDESITGDIVRCEEKRARRNEVEVTAKYVRKVGGLKVIPATRASSEYSLGSFQAINVRRSRQTRILLGALMPFGLGARIALKKLRMFGLLPLISFIEFSGTEKTKCSVGLKSGARQKLRDLGNVRHVTVASAK